MRNLAMIFRFAFIVGAVVCLINSDFEMGMLYCIFVELINIELKIGGEE